MYHINKHVQSWYALVNQFHDCQPYWARPTTLTPCFNTTKFYNAGCKVMFDQKECRVYYQANSVLTSGRDPVIELSRLTSNTITIYSAHPALRHLDLQMQSKPLHCGSQTSCHVSNVHISHYTQNQTDVHAPSMFSPPITTPINTLHNDFSLRFPFTKSKLTRTYLSTSPATLNGK